MKKLFLALFSSTTKNTSVLIVGNAIASILAILFTLVAARELEPAQWGMIAAVISVITIGEALGDLGLSASLYRFFSKSIAQGKHEEAKNFRDIAFFIRLTSACAIFLVLALLSRLISPILFKNPDWFLTFISGLGMFAYLVLDFQIALLQVRGKWGLSALFLTLVNLFRLLGVYILYKLGALTVTSTLWMYSGTPFLFFFVLLLWEPVSLKFLKEKATVKSLLTFSGWLGLNRIAGAIASRIDVLLLLGIAGAYQTGLFGAAKQLAIGVPLVIGSLATVLAPRFSTLGERELSGYFKKSIGLAMLLSLGLFAGILISPFVISLFGPKYQESRVILQWLLVGYVPFVVSMPAVNLLIYAFHKPKIIGVLSVVQILLVWFFSVLLIPVWGVWGAVAVHIIWNLSTLLVAYVFVAYYLSKQGRMSWAKQ